MVGVSRHGAVGRENVGISSKKAGENPAHRKSKVSWATQIDPGLVGPKLRPRGVGDGQQVNIPALPHFCFVGAFLCSKSVFWLYAFTDSNVSMQMKPQGGINSCKIGTKKSLETLKVRDPYRKPTQVGRHKCAKVYERTLV